MMRGSAMRGTNEKPFQVSFLMFLTFRSYNANSASCWVLHTLPDPQ
jgi:hypothetical protein